MKFNTKNYFMFVLPLSILFILIYVLILSPYIARINETLEFVIFIVGMMGICMGGVYFAVRDKKKEKKDKTSFPDMKTNYKNLDHNRKTEDKTN